MMCKLGDLLLADSRSAASESALMNVSFFVSSSHPIFPFSNDHESPAHFAPLMKGCPGSTSSIFISTAARTRQRQPEGRACDADITSRESCKDRNLQHQKGRSARCAQSQVPSTSPCPKQQLVLQTRSGKAVSWGLVWCRNCNATSGLWRTHGNGQIAPRDRHLRVSDEATRGDDGDYLTAGPGSLPHREIQLEPQPDKPLLVREGKRRCGVAAALVSHGQASHRVVAPMMPLKKASSCSLRCAALCLVITSPPSPARPVPLIGGM